MELTKAQEKLLGKLKRGQKLIQINKTWMGANVFTKDVCGECQRENIKVVNALIEKRIIIEKRTTQNIYTEFELTE